MDANADSAAGNPPQALPGSTRRAHGRLTASGGRLRVDIEVDADADMRSDPLSSCGGISPLRPQESRSYAEVQCKCSLSPFGRWLVVHLMRREWDPADLIASWTLVEPDWDLVANKTGATRLGFSVSLKFFEIGAGSRSTLPKSRTLRWQSRWS